MNDGASARPTGRVADHHAEERISTRQLKSTYTPVDASARPATGRVAAQRAEAMEEELSSLQLTSEKELQSPTITSRHQELALQGDAHGACPNRTFSTQQELALQGNAGSAYPNKVQRILHSEAHFCGHLDNAYGAYPNGVLHLSQDATKTSEVYKVLPEQKQMDGLPPATGKPVVQFCENAIPGSTVVRPYSGTRQNFTVKENSTGQIPERRTTELEHAGNVYHTARTKREDSSYMEEPSTKPELRTKERKVLLYESGDSTDEDASEIRRHRKKKAEADAKVSSTQHSPPKKSDSSSRESRYRTSSRTNRDRRRSSTNRPRSTSTEDRKCDNRKSPREARKARNGSEESSAASSSDEEETIATPKHILKPPKFHGQSSFETFMAQFSNCAEHNRWNDAQKLAYLRNSLEKEAAYVLWDYGKDAIGSLSGLMKILETRFGGKAVANKHRIELRNRRRRGNETLQSVHSDIRRLAALAYPSVQPQMREEITCDHFLDALGDADFALKIRQQQPADLDSALRIALQLEVWAEDAARHRDASKHEKGGSRRSRTKSPIRH